MYKPIKSVDEILIDAWPYSDMIALLRAGNPAWRETNEKTYLDQLGALPPIRHQDGAFMVGELFDEVDGHNIYAAFINVGDRYFCRLAPIKSFDPLRYQIEIRKQFNF